LGKICGYVAGDGNLKMEGKSPWGPKKGAKIFEFSFKVYGEVGWTRS